MYLEHFGLDEPPFKITPVTDFFFPGANRGEILDALIYAITESEGIIKVTGEVGSGKTMLCRMLLERLPPQMENVYLANPSLSREEMLYAIADGLGLKLDGERVNVIMQTLQNLLEKKSAEGQRVVILVDEAHAMPLDTLEELRLLYNLQLGDRKLLQIVLFGQPELNDKLSQPNMRQLKDRIVHHFSMLPLSKNIVESYLLFRMRTAGYRGPNIFSAAAINLIGSASNGLMRRVNILADKSLLAAFIENTHNIEVRHVQAAIRDSELAAPLPWHKDKGMLAIVGTISALLLAGMGWYLGSMQSSGQNADNLGKAEPGLTALPATSTPSNVIAAASTIATASTVATVPTIAANSAVATVTAIAAISAVAISAAPPTSVPAASAVAAEIAVTTPVPMTTADAGTPPLLAQRLIAAKNLYAKRNQSSASIQLFYTTEMKPERVEAFLHRADALGKLAEIYVLPTRINRKDGIRVLFGDYPDIAAARAAIEQLPRRYKTGFGLKLYFLDSAQIVNARAQ